LVIAVLFSSTSTRTFEAGEIMNWEERIEINPGVLVGKPVIKNTRLAVEFIVELLANGWSQQQIIENYPGITIDDIQACLTLRRRHPQVRAGVLGAGFAMNVLANENFPRVAVEALRAAGHHVLWASGSCPGRRAAGYDVRQGFRRIGVSMGSSLNLWSGSVSPPHAGSGLYFGTRPRCVHGCNGLGRAFCRC
jgi:uncharacterized protein (DUF433 family)